MLAHPDTQPIREGRFRSVGSVQNVFAPLKKTRDITPELGLLNCPFVGTAEVSGIESFGRTYKRAQSAHVPPKIKADTVSRFTTVLAGKVSKMKLPLYTALPDHM